MINIQKLSDGTVEFTEPFLKTKVKLHFNDGYFFITDCGKYEYERRIESRINFPGIVKDISRGLYHNYKTKQGKEHFAITNWAIEKGCKLNYKKIKPYLEELINNNLSEKELMLERKVYSVIGPKTKVPIELIRLASQSEKSINELMKYNGAIYTLSQKFPVASWGLEALTIADVENKLLDWQNLLYNNKKRNRAINITLSNLTTGLNRYIPHFPYLNLEVPVLNKTILISLLNMVSYSNYGYPNNYIKINHEKLIKLYQYTNLEELRKAYNKIARFNHWGKVKFSKSRTLGQYYTFIVDYLNTLNYECNCQSINGFVERSIEWHKDTNRNRVKKYNQANSDVKTFRPENIEFPQPKNKDTKITFLDTVGAIENEGDTMHHCVGSYGDRAVRGDILVFHVDYAGEAATISIQIAPKRRYDGSLNTDRYNMEQAYGPGNRNNKASAYAKKIFNSWCKKQNEKLKTENIPVLANASESMDVDIPF